MNRTWSSHHEFRFTSIHQKTSETLETDRSGFVLHNNGILVDEQPYQPMADSYDSWFMLVISGDISKSIQMIVCFIGTFVAIGLAKTIIPHGLQWPHPIQSYPQLFELGFLVGKCLASWWKTSCKPVEGIGWSPCSGPSARSSKDEPQIKPWSNETSAR